MILLVTQNARYHHASFGLRYLLANLGELKEQARILESTIKEPPLNLAERILELAPRIVGLSVYIWNVHQALELATALKRLKPELCLVVGGPEVSHELEEQPWMELADYVVTGEGDLAFADLCRKLLAGERPVGRLIPGGRPPVERLADPYAHYDQHDLEHRVVYVEASRGCPFRCEFCLSALDPGARAFPLEEVLQRMEGLHRRGLRRFKFVDRTFNLKVETGRAILEFFQRRWCPELFLHFEMIPDRLPPGLREPITAFAPGCLQFEVGIQTFNEEVGHRISRRQNYQKVEDNLRFLRTQTGAHLHVDLIVGLPGETLASFAAGFDRLVDLGPQEIQVGILKRLKGTPIIRHDQEFEMLYHHRAPYPLLSNRDLDFSTMQRLKRFARYWDLVANQGRFPRSLRRLLGDTPFDNFFAFSEFLFERESGTSGLSPTRLGQALADFTGGTEEVEADFRAQDRQLPTGLRRQARHTVV